LDLEVDGGVVGVRPVVLVVVPVVPVVRFVPVAAVPVVAALFVAAVVADGIAEQPLPAVSLLVPAAGRIRVRPEVPEKMRRALGPAPYQWVGTFPRPVPSGLPATGTLRRGIDEVELPVVPDAPWILATVLPDGASVYEHLAPASPLVARLRVPEVPVAGPVTLPVRAALPWDPAVLVALAAMVV